MGGVEKYESVAVEVNLLLDQWAAVGWLVAAVALYAISCIGLYTIGRRRGLRNSWLAWIPVFNLWLLGSISDQYGYLVKGKIRSRRILLPILAALTLIMYLVGGYCVYLSRENGYMTAAQFAMPMLMAFVSLVAVFAGGVATIVWAYMCCYDLFRSCDPADGKLFLVLILLFPGALPFILFAIRERDGGMPPRKKPAEEPEEMIEETEGEPENEQEIPVADA